MSQMQAFLLSAMVAHPNAGVSSGPSSRFCSWRQGSLLELQHFLNHLRSKRKTRKNFYPLGRLLFVRGLCTRMEVNIWSMEDDACGASLNL